MYLDGPAGGCRRNGPSERHGCRNRGALRAAIQLVLGRVLINRERSQTWRCPRYPRKRISGLACGTPALCRIAEVLRLAANRDSILLTKTKVPSNSDRCH